VVDVVVVNPDIRSSAARLSITSDAPAIASVVHAATWQAGAVAPGQIVVIGGSNFGPDALAQSTVAEGRLPATVSSTTVYFDGTPAPLVWASRGQSAVIVPWSVSGKTTIDVSLDVRGTRSAAVSVPVQPAAPGLFTVNGTGQGQVAALNQDGTPNSADNPASAGSMLVLYGTGEGLVSPTPEIGSVIDANTLPRPQLPVAVQIGGAPAAVEYAGSVAGATTGLFQINVRVPSGIPAGNAVPVLVSVGPHTSASGVTVALR
jgi:uncharacterized protein (TIGR03437 family)